MRPRNEVGGNLGYITMKKLILIILLFVTTFANAQVTIKGITLGQRTSIRDYKQTSVAGINGTLAPYKLKDGRFYSLGFIPTKDGYSFTRLYSYEVDNFKTAIEKKFGVKFEEITEVDDYTQRVYAAAIVNQKIIFRVVVETYYYMEPSLKFTFTVGNIDLLNLKLEEDASETVSDF